MASKKLTPSISSMTVKEVGDSFHITDRQKGCKTLTKLYSLWKKNLLCDVIIKVTCGEIPAHRNVLATSSDYFQAMFTLGMEETQQSHITMESVNYDTMLLLINYIYTGHLEVHRENVQELVIVTDMIQMSELKLCCCQFLERNVDIHNALGLWSFAERYSCETLKIKCLHLLKQRFQAVCRTEEFMNLPKEQLMLLIEMNDLLLGRDGEVTVLEGVLRWLESNIDDRLADLAEILTHVHVDTIPTTKLKSFWQREFVTKHPEIKRCIGQAIVLPSTGTPRIPMQEIYVLGGYLQSRTGPLCPRLQTVEKYNVFRGSWENIAGMPILASGVKVFPAQGRLLCIAVEMIQAMDDSTDFHLEGFYEYDSLGDKWIDARHCFSKDARQALHNCLMKSGSLAVCQRTGNIYTVSATEIACIERIDCDTEESGCLFQTVRKLPLLDILMSENREYFTSVVCNDNLYVLGGHEKLSQTELFPKADMFMFDCDADQWVARANMKEPRARMDAVELNGLIYAVGGFNRYRLSTVEVYDPETDQWSNVANMNKQRSAFKLVSDGQRLYALGGKSYSFNFGGTRKVLSMCEMYDPTTNVWTNIEPLKQARCMFGAAII